MTDVIDHLPETDEPAPPKKARGRKKGQQPKERKPIPLEMLEMHQPPEDERYRYRRKRTPLDDQTEALIQTCQGVYQDWLDAGQPTAWPDMPVVVWPVDKEFEDDALFYLRKAAGLINRKLVLGEIQEFTPEGTDRLWVEIPYCVIARPPKRENGNTEE